ncbi:MAG TPA: YeeE/YedE thiosulfate transporter family protein [Polyangium sp.]|nr:YeeE/YedE thiosulfate transporter family protein [Polyangium sp.]
MDTKSIFVETWPGWAGGALISVAVVGLLLTRNRQLGVSFCYAFAIDRLTDWFEARNKKNAPSSPAATFPMPGSEPNAASENPADFPMPNAFPMPSSSSALPDESSWPIIFLIGIFLGGIASGILTRAFSGSPFELNLDYAGFDALWKVGPFAKAAILFGGGILVGFGTRMGGGCTSGHAIMGAPGLQKASIVAMCVFMGMGIATTFLLKALL